MLVRDIEGDELDLQMAMTDEEKQIITEAIASKTWRALRIASKSRLGALDQVQNGRPLKEVFQPEQPRSESR